MRIFSFRKIQRLFSFASMGIARSNGRGVRRRNAFKQRRDALNRHQLGNEPLEPRLLLATNITAGNRAPDLLPTSDSGSFQTDNYTNDNTPTFEFDAGGLTFGSTPAASGPETLELLIDGASRPFTMAGGLNSFNGGGQANRELTLNNPLADGTYTATFRIRDNQGTPATSTSPGLTFIIDTTINPVNARLVSGGNQSGGVHTPGDDIVITLTFDEEVEFGGGNTQSAGDPDTFINLNVGTPLSATDPVAAEVTGSHASGGLVTEQQYTFAVQPYDPDPALGTFTDADGIFIDSVSGIFYDRAGNSVTDPTLGSYRGFKTGTLTFTNPVTSSTLVGVLDNSQISYPVSGITLLLDAPVPGPPVTPVGVAVGIEDFQLTRDGQIININGASITSPIIGPNAFQNFLLGDLEQYTDTPGRYRLAFVDASIGPIATLEWVKSVPTAGELVASLTPFPTDTTPTTPRNIPVEGIALEFLNNAGNPTPVTGVDTTAVGTAITQFEIYKDGVLVPWTTPALGAVNISGSGSNYSINGLASFTNSDGYYQVFLSDSSAIETLDGTQLITTYSTSWEFTSKVTISSVIPPLSSTYKNNEVLSFDVNFSDFVNIDPASPPTLTIDIGGQLRTAAYAAGDGTQTLTFNYTVGSVVGSDDIDLDGIELRSPLAGTVTDLWGTAVDPRLTPPSMATVFVLSTTPTIPPTIDSIESGSTQPRITGTAQLSDGDTLSVVVAGISNSYHGSTYTVVPVNNTWTLDMSAVNPDNVEKTGCDIPAPISAVITVPSTAGLKIGMGVSGHTDIPIGAKILTVGATSIVLDTSVTTGAGTLGATLTFSATPTEAALTNPDNYSVTAIITDAAGNTIDETDVFNTGTTAPTIETLLTSSDVPTIRGSAVLQAGESLSITVNGATYGNVTTSNVTAAGDIANGSVEIDNIDTSDLVVGLVVNHSNFPVGTIITAIDPTGGSVSNGKITVDQASTVVTPANPTSITFENLWSLDLGTVLPSTGTLGAFVDGVAVDVVATVFGSIGYSITDTTTGELTVDRTLTPVAPGLAILPDAADGATSTEAAAGVVTVSGVLGNTITVTFTGQAGVVEKTVTATGGLAQVVTLTGPELSTLGEGAVQVSAVQTDPAGNVSPSTSATSTPVTGGPQTPATEFDVGIEVGAGLPSTFNAIAEAATNIWSQVIVGDLSDQVHPTTGEVIDELYIEFQAGLLGASPSDGTNGTLANAGPRNFRGAGDADPFLPYRGEVGIDMADINNPDLLDIVVHEIGHVLGFPFSTPFQNLITPAGFTGSNAVAEFVALGIDPLATAIPLDANEAHWAESVLGNEVMSQYAGPQYYLSRVTIGAFEDIGYEVNYAGADTYALFIANAESAFSIDTTVPDDATIALTPGVSDPIGTTTATDSAGFISVEGEAGAEIIVTFTDGSANVVTKTIIGSGAAQQVSLSAADLLLLDDGSVTVEVAQTDAAGNPQTGSPGNQVSITLDTDVPLAPVLALGVGVGDGATAGEATQVGGVVTVNGEASSSIEVTFTGSNGSVIKTIAGTGSAAAVTLNTNDLANIGGGTVTVSAIQTDEAGNTQTEPASTIVFELTIPIAPTVDALTTATVLPTITGTTGTGSALNAGEVLTVTINGATYEVTPDVSGDWSLDLSTAAPISGSLNTFTDGNYSVTATVTDTTGNAATDGTTNEITIDTTAPASPTVDAFITNNDSPTITGTATLTDDESLTVTVNGTTYDTTGDVTVVGNTWSLDLSALSAPVTLSDATYSVTATATDIAGNTINDGTTEELVVDTVAPTVSTVTTSTPDGTYGIGAVIDIVIQMSEDVTVDTALGSPRLTLNTVPARTANFTSAVGNILTFTYTSQDGDTAANLDVDALNLNGAVIEDAAGNAVDDSNLGTTVNLDAAIVINAVIPSATVTVTGLGDTYTYDVDQVIELTADFGTAVDVVGTPTISLLIGNTPVAATYATGSGTSAIKFRYQVQQGDLDEDGIEIPTAAIELAANTTITDVELGNDVQLTFAPPNTQQVNVNSLPRVEGIAASFDGASIADGSYDTGDVITLTLNTTRPVKVSDPQNTKLYLNTDGSNATDYAIFVGDSSTFSDQLEFQYTVADGDNSEDLDYLNTTSLDFGPGTIKSAAGINLSSDLQVPGTLNSLSYGNEIIINTRAPQIESFSTINPDNRYSVGQNIVIRATLSEEVTANQTFELVLDTGVGRTVQMTTDGSTRASGIYTIQPGDSSDALKVLDILPGSLVDAAGNSLLTTLPSSITVGNIIVDTTAPTITNFNVTEINGSPASASESGLFGVGSTLKIEATTDETVRAGSTIEATLNNGDVVRLSAATAGTTLSGTYTVGSDPSSTNPDLSVDNFIPIVMRDVAGNSIETPTAIPAFPNNIGDVHDLEIDTTPPNVVEFTADDGTYKAGDNIAITATLSEEINGTHDLKIELSSGGFANLAIADGANIAVGNYTVQPGDTTSDLTVAKIYAGSIVDFANNQLFTVLPSGTNLGDTANIVLDTTAPTVESLVSDLTTINSTQSATIDITLNEDSTDFSIFDLNTTSGRFDPLSFSGSGSNYTVGFIPDADFEGDAVISVENGSFNDTVGNAFNSTTPTLTIAVDSKAPTVGISADNTSLLAGDTSTLTLTLSEEAANATDFGFADLAVSNGTLDINTFTPVTATEYTVVYTPEQDFEGTVTFNVAGSTFSDTFLNPNEASTDFNISVDTKVPTATLTSDLASLNATQNATINISLSEASSFAETGDVPSANATTEINSVDTTDLAVGMAVSGGDVPVGATIASIDSATQLTLSAPVAAGTGTIGESLTFMTDETGNVPSSTLTSLITNIDTTNLAVGMTVSGGDVPVGATIISMAFGTQLTLNTPVTTGSGTLGEALTFTTTENGNVPPSAGPVVDVITNVDTTNLAIGMTVSGTHVPVGATIAGMSGTGPAQTITLSADVITGTGGITSLTFTTDMTGDVPSATLTREITDVDTTDLAVGMTVSGGDIPGGATIATIDSATQLTLSAPVVAGSGTTGEALTFTTSETGDVPSANAVSEISNTDTSDLTVGMTISGGDIPADATIASIDSLTQLTLSAPVTTGTGTTGESLAFGLEEFEFGDLTVTNGTLDPATFTAINSTEFSVVFTPDAATTGDAVISIPADSFKDLSGNNNSVDSNLTIAVDTVSPTVVDVTPVLSTLNASQNTVVNINLSEDSADFTVDDLTATNGTFENGSFTGSGSNYSVVFVPDADIEDNAVISVANGSFTDLTANPLNSTAPNATLTLDTKLPTVDITPDDPTLSIGENTTLTLTLSDAPGNVSDFTFENLSVSNGTLDSATFTNVNSTTYEVDYTPDVDFEGNVTVLAAAGQFTDAALNPNAEGNLTLAVDTKAPVATITSDINPVNGLQNATISISLSEDSSDFDFADLSPTNGVLDPTSFTGSGSNYSVVFIPFSATTDDAVISIAADSFTDGSGNNNSVESNLTIAVDTVAPTVLDITPVLSSLNATQNTSISINLSEDSADFTVDDLTVTNGEFENGSFTGSGSNYSVVFVPFANVEDTAVVSVENGSFTDLAGNPLNSTAPNATLTLDTKAPAAPALTLEGGLPVTNPVSLDEATQDPNGVVSVQGEVGANINVSFTGTDGSVQKTITGDGTTQGVVLNSTEAASLGQGPVSVVATQTDAFLNPQTDPASTVSFELDTIAPNAATVAFAAGVTDAVSDAESSAPVTVNGELDAALTVTFTGDDGSVTQNLTGTGVDQNVNLNAAQLLMIDSDGVGPVEVSVTQSDLAGNNQTADAETLTYALDTVAPSAPGLTLAGSDPLSADEAATPVTISAEANASVTVVFEGVSGNVTQSITGTGSSQNVALNTAQLATLGDGLVSVSASQVDQAGNPQSGAANTSAFTLDTIAPAAPQLALGNGIVGTVSSDEATRPAGVVTVQGEVASTITVTFLGTSGATVPKSITGDGTAQGVVLTLTDLATLGDGAVSVSATQADEAGNQQTLPATTMSFNLDATAPAAAGLSLNIPTGDLPVGINEVTQPTGIVVVSGELDAEITITFAGQANTIVKQVSGTNTPQPITLTLSEAEFLGQGTVTVTVSQTDDAGNLQDAVAASVTFDLDTIAPVTPVVSLESSIIPAVSLDEATQDPAGVVTVVGEAGATVVVTLTGSADQIDKTITSTGTDGVVLTNADLIILGEGTVNVSAIQTDPSGNVSPVGTTSFVLDSIAPVAPAIALTSTLDNPVSEAEALSSSGVVTVTGEVSAAIVVTLTGQSGTLTRNLTGVGAPQAVILSSGDLTALGDGPVTVTAVQTDEAGNDSPAGSLPSFVLDTVAPTAPVVALNVSVTDPITASEATQATGIATVTGENGSTIAVTLVGSNNLPVVKQIAGNGSTLMPVVLNGSDLIILGEGIVNVTAIQTDEAGNQQTVGGASLSFVLDTVNPEVSHFNATTPSGNYPAGETINLVATLSEVTASGTEFTAVLNTGATVVFTASSTGTVLEGSYTIGGTHNANPLAVTSILPGTVLDEAGNSLATTVPTSNTFNGIAVDTTSPQPAAIALLSSDPVSGSEATAPGGFATVTAEPGATVDITITGTNGSLSQSLLGTGSAQPIKLTAGNLPTLGDGLVTLTAVQTDAAGNRQILPDQTIAFTLDTVIPATPTMELGTEVSDGATAAEATQAAGVVRVTGEAGASISVTLTGTAGTVTPSPIIANGVSQAVRLTSSDLNTLGEGLVIVSAVQTDAAGNTQPIAAELTFRLDTVAPAEPVVNLANGVTNPISLAEATQVAAAGGLLSVRGEAGAELTITFSGALGGVTRTLTATGFNQPIELSPAEVTSLGDGLLDVTARQVDPAGNDSSETAPMNLTLDTVDPTIYSRLLDAPAGFYNAGDQIPIVITLSEPAVPGQQLSVLLNVLDPSDNPVRVLATVGTGADAVKALGTYTVASGQNTADLAIDSVLNDQANNFVTDVAGNTLIDDNAQQSSSISSLGSGSSSSSSSSVSSGIVIDTSAPEILGISTPSIQSVYKEGDTVTIVVGLSEAVQAGSKIEVKVNSRPETQPSLVLEALADGTTMIGHYTVGLAEVANQLAISSISANIFDLAGNQFVHSESNSLVSSLLSGIEIDGSITVVENGANWGPQPEEGYQSVTIDLTANVTGVTLDAFTVTHNGRTISLRDASLQQTTSANYVLRLPNRVANLSGGFSITIWSTDIRTLTTSAEDMDKPIVIVMPDPGINTDLTNGRTTGD